MSDNHKKIISNAQQRNDANVIDRADSILQYLNSKSKILGERVELRIFTESDFRKNLDDSESTYLELLAHSGCFGKDDLFFFLRYLKTREFIDYSDNDADKQTCVLTVGGHARLAELEKTDTASSTAFVAMWFDDSMHDAWERGIEPAIRDAGYEPVRIDQQEHVNKIDDEIIAEIRRARFVVADFTHGDKGARGGVYYEAGFAHGLDIPVIFTCREGLLDQIHFDTRQYNHILWTEPNELRNSLADRIMATLGDGPHKQLC